MPQPRQQITLPARHGGILREVRVEIDEPREHRRALGMQPAHGLRARLPRELLVFADLGDLRTIDDQRAIFPRAQPVVCRRIEQEAADAEERGVGAHWDR